MGKTSQTRKGHAKAKTSRLYQVYNNLKQSGIVRKIAILSVAGVMLLSSFFTGYVSGSRKEKNKLQEKGGRTEESDYEAGANANESYETARNEVTAELANHGKTLEVRTPERAYADSKNTLLKKLIKEGVFRNPGLAETDEDGFVYAVFNVGSEAMKNILAYPEKYAEFVQVTQQDRLHDTLKSALRDRNGKYITEFDIKKGTVKVYDSMTGLPCIVNLSGLNR